MRKRGTSSTSAGTVSKASTTVNTWSRPGNRSRAKAYAAVALVPSWATTVPPANSSVLTYHRSMGRAAAAIIASRMLHPRRQQPELRPHEREQQQPKQSGDRGGLLGLLLLPLMRAQFRL